MKLKKKLKKLEIEISELRKQVQTDKIIFTDCSNPNLIAVISLKNGVFLIEKNTRAIETTNESQIILLDNK
jgi:hypothetical protein